MIEVSLNHDIYKFFHISSTEAIPHNLKLNSDLSNYRETMLEAKTLALNTTHVNLGGNSRFNAHFMDAMMFE